MVESFYDILERLHSKHVGHKKTLAEVRYIEQCIIIITAYLCNLKKCIIVVYIDKMFLGTKDVRVLT